MLKTLNFRTGSWGPLALGFLLMGCPVSAQQPSATPDTRSRPRAETKGVAIPTCLERLTLTQPQQDRVREIVRKDDGDIESAWQQFGALYLDSVRTEVLLLSAIEDNLSDAQRDQVREQRRKTARHHKGVAGAKVDSDAAVTQPTSAAEEEREIVGVSLTPEQELAADKLQEKYLSRLRTLDRDIQGLHNRLISLEADKLVEIESVLSEEQLLQLREIRKTAPAEHAAAAKRTSPAETR